MPASVATEEERAMLTTYVFLTTVLTVFERDAAILETSGVLKTSGPYVEAIRQAQSKVFQDLKEIKAEFRNRGIKVYEETNERDHKHIKFGVYGFCGGTTLNVILYTNRNMWWNLCLPYGTIILKGRNENVL